MKVFSVQDASTVVRVRRPEWESGCLPASPREFLEQLGDGGVVSSGDSRGSFDFSSRLLTWTRDGTKHFEVASETDEALEVLGQALKDMQDPQYLDVPACETGETEATGVSADCLQIVIKPKDSLSCGFSVCKERDAEMAQLRQESAEKDREMAQLRQEMEKVTETLSHLTQVYHCPQEIVHEARQGNVEAIKAFLEKGGKVNTSDEDGYSLLWASASACQLETAKLLLERGARVDAPNKYGRTPLWEAASKGHLPTVKLLVEKGTTVDFADYNGQTPLWRAAFKGHLQTVRFLVEKGAKVEKCTVNGETPLMRAAFEGHLETVKYLFEKGAKVDRKDKDGLTPLWFAERKNHHEVAAFLRSKGA
uniref:Uncharacterized protein n=1 Tax=Chromera velia CCMP2878 TaxID=1169474 RepID=A0A0G4G9T6_9ALVE|eukprot:Cvel_4385.t1-p1 / transcript=Cvel_4385.t1 / gene=Cvel_4385 / organism=Chromera_velia_CCMP2878 / gene_product=Protein TANC1, putative / transcript_product=Protein TANC1, putative / location=Cvel_scaffold190:47713-52885(-) / protein_length=364 / sequence_SO=supercontig / SO=protein_coding / is_pseudo=false